MDLNGQPAAPAVRLAHLSDIHITADHLDWKPEDWLTKRLTGWINYRWGGRGRRFRYADEVLTAAVRDLRQRRPTHLIFSGDATCLGFETEFARAADLLGVQDSALRPALAVPGNHDYYTRRVAASGLFERYFSPWQEGERVDGEVYPFAQRVGPVWLIGLNSCTGNRWFWDAAGSVGTEQLRRLEQLLQRLAPGPRILVTHYPVCGARGQPEDAIHRLRDVAEVVRVAGRGGVSLWLHGHRHGPYYLNDLKIAPFPLVCAGSTTQAGVWSYGEYTIEGTQLHGRRRVYVPEEHTFRDSDTFQLELRP
jgi:3',5'-cyclic AMP phosphodiesterase CpdA